MKLLIEIDADAIQKLAPKMTEPQIMIAIVNGLHIRTHMYYRERFRIHSMLDYNTSAMLKNVVKDSITLKKVES